MSFASSQHLSPTYKNITASGNLNVSGTSNLSTTFIDTSGGQTVNGLRVNNTNPASSGSSTNSIQVLQGNYGLALSAQLTQGVGASFSLGTGDINDGFDTVMSGDQNTLTIASTNLNANNLNVSNNLTVGSNGIDFLTPNISIGINSSSNMLFTTFAGAGFYFNQPVYVTGAVSSNALTADTMEVGLTTSTNPTRPTTSQHIGFVIKESFQNESLVTNVSNGLLTFTLPKGTFMINGILQLDVQSNTNFNSIVISQSLGSTVVSTFTSTQLVPNDSSNDINVNLPIMNTIFNSVEQSFTISALSQYIHI